MVLCILILQRTLVSEGKSRHSTQSGAERNEPIKVSAQLAFSTLTQAWVPCLGNGAPLPTVSQSSHLSFHNQNNPPQPSLRPSYQAILDFGELTVTTINTLIQ